MKLPLSTATFLFCIILLCSTSLNASGEFEDTLTPSDPASSRFFSNVFQNISNAFDYDLKVLSYITNQETVESTQNPGNRFLNLPLSSFDNSFKVNLYYSYGALWVSAKYRFNPTWKAYQYDSVEYIDDRSLNEYLIRMEAIEEISLSYGREILQWGPSYISSPSNPFSKKDNLKNPKEELPGMDYLRIVYTPNMSWSISAISNVGEGERQDIDEFNTTNVLKLDYMSYKSYISLIMSHQDKTNLQIGGFGRWTISDNLLLYSELSFLEENHALYPVENTSSPFLYSMEKTKQDEKGTLEAMVIGAAYTFNSLDSLTFEYLRNTFGYNKDETTQYLNLRKSAADAYVEGTALYDYARVTLAQTADNGLRYLRQNYALAHYTKTDLWNQVDVSLRLTVCLDDLSTQVLIISERGLGDHFGVYGILTDRRGGSDTEFESVLSRQLVLGIEAVF